jgi:hypothetical protein
VAVPPRHLTGWKGEVKRKMASFVCTERYLWRDSTKRCGLLHIYLGLEGGPDQDAG